MLYGPWNRRPTACSSPDCSSRGRAQRCPVADWPSSIGSDETFTFISGLMAHAEVPVHWWLSLAPTLTRSSCTLFGGSRREERSMIATSTKAALAACQGSHVAWKLGGPKLVEAQSGGLQRPQDARRPPRGHSAADHTRDYSALGATSLHQCAMPSTHRGISTPRGCRWYAKSVSNVLARRLSQRGAALSRRFNGSSSGPRSRREHCRPPSSQISLKTSMCLFRRRNRLR